MGFLRAAIFFLLGIGAAIGVYLTGLFNTITHMDFGTLLARPPAAIASAPPVDLPYDGHGAIACRVPENSGISNHTDRVVLVTVLPPEGVPSGAVGPGQSVEMRSYVLAPGESTDAPRPVDCQDPSPVIPVPPNAALVDPRRDAGPPEPDAPADCGRTSGPCDSGDSEHADIIPNGEQR